MSRTRCASTTSHLLGSIHSEQPQHEREHDARCIAERKACLADGVISGSHLVVIIGQHAAVRIERMEQAGKVLRVMRHAEWCAIARRQCNEVTEVGDPAHEREL